MAETPQNNDDAAAAAEQLRVLTEATTARREFDELARQAAVRDQQLAEMKQALLADRLAKWVTGRRVDEVREARDGGPVCDCDA
ncbi:hypothetical protein LTR36_009609 [Oleoguttula mirabilis]|uniref:Uncharacterized protein n=1 Tax=Oleoguttula mirabilis TaxID=1507867 RepID=A0AAV9J5J4_9PEZI|nr:hypothetical protein LTR36_009609 [Oleoguttula mirabilis]